MKFSVFKLFLSILRSKFGKLSVLHEKSGEKPAVIITTVQRAVSESSFLNLINVPSAAENTVNLLASSAVEGTVNLLTSTSLGSQCSGISCQGLYSEKIGTRKPAVELREIKI